MVTLYFASEWVVNTDIVFRKLVNVTDQLGLGLVIIRDVEQNAAGLFVYTVAVRMSEKNLLEEFKEKIGREIRLTEWYAISGEEYEQGKKLKDIIDSMEPFEYTSWLDGMNYFGRQNEIYRDRVDHDTQDAVYHSCDWRLFPDQLLRFKGATSLVSKLYGAIYLFQLRRNRQGYHVLTFGTRTPSISALQSFMKEFGDSLGLTNCHSISSDEFYSGIKVSEQGFYSASAIADWYSKYALENQERDKN